MSTPAATSFDQHMCMYVRVVCRRVPDVAVLIAIIGKKCRLNTTQTGRGHANMHSIILLLNLNLDKRGCFRGI